MRSLFFLLRKEFRQIFRNPSILRLILVLPVVQLIIMPLAADYEIKNINLSIIDHDHSTYSRKMIDKIVASGYFRINDYSESFSESMQQFNQDQADIIIEIPANFEKNLIRENKQNIFLAANAINGVKALIGSSYLSKILVSYNKNIRQEFIPATKFKASPTINIAILNKYNPHLDYPTFMVPGILVILVTMVGSYMCALNIVKEKEVGTIEQINVTPIKKIYFILGKLIPFWVLGNIIFTIGFMGIARFFYQIIPVGSIFLVYAFLAVYLVAVLGIGLLISTYSSTQQQAMSLAFFFMMIFILMGGLFTPTDSMPEWAKWIVRLNPVSYFIEVMRLIILKGSTFKNIQQAFLTICAMALFFNTWAIVNYRKTS